MLSLSLSLLLCLITVVVIVGSSGIGSDGGRGDSTLRVGGLSGMISPRDQAHKAPNLSIRGPALGVLSRSLGISPTRLESTLRLRPIKLI